MNDEMSTKPTMETLLARMNEWGASLTAGQEELRQSVQELRRGQDELRKGQDELRKGQEELRTDLRTGLHRVERKIEILNDNFLTIKADIRDLEVRLEKLESEPLAKN
jgi:septal ring factor EnvC (AmiA/AmiB activator)